jgi:hypothetical protein
LSDARDVQNTVGINTKGKRDGRNTRQFELAEQFVALYVSTISLVYLNKHIGLVVKLRGEDFDFFVGTAVLRMMRTVKMPPAVLIPRERRATLRKRASIQKYYRKESRPGQLYHRQHPHLG